MMCILSAFFFDTNANMIIVFKLTIEDARILTNIWFESTAYG